MSEVICLLFSVSGSSLTARCHVSQGEVSLNEPTSRVFVLQTTAKESEMFTVMNSSFLSRSSNCFYLFKECLDVLTLTAVCLYGCRFLFFLLNGTKNPVPEQSLYENVSKCISFLFFFKSKAAFYFSPELVSYRYMNQNVQENGRLSFSFVFQ